jgi:hypothetical protein
MIATLLTTNLVPVLDSFYSQRESAPGAARMAR